MANLVIDIGNTFIKIAAFEQDKLLYTEQHTSVNIGELLDWAIKFRVEKAIIASVKHDYERWQLALERQVTVLNFNAAMATGITNHYLTPDTLGLDRLAAVTGANYLYPGKNTLVIDGGTCITYDWVDTKGNYFGGSISPGLNMRYQALNNYTASLPLIKGDTTFHESYGNNTLTAIKSGVQNGIKYEIAGFIKSYMKDAEELNIVLTGGDSNFFDTLLKNSIFAPYIKIEPHLVLKGLNAAITQHND